MLQPDTVPLEKSVIAGKFRTRERFKFWLIKLTSMKRSLPMVGDRKFNIGRLLIGIGIFFSIFSAIMPASVLNDLKNGINPIISFITSLTGSIPDKMSYRGEFVFLGMVAIISGLLVEIFVIYSDIRRYDMEKKALRNLKMKMNIVFTFLVSFFISRFYVVLFRPDVDPVYGLWIRGLRIHHFVIGVLLLITSGGMGLLLESRWKMAGGILYGAGLGLTVDEFGLLITSGDYWSSISYTFFVLLALILLNIILLEAHSIRKNMIVAGGKSDSPILDTPESGHR